MAVTRPPIGRAIFFFGAVSVLAFGGCAAWSVSKTECLVQLASASLWSPMTNFFADQYDAKRLNEADRAVQFERLNARLFRLARALRGLPELVREPILRLSLAVTEWYTELPAYQQAAVPVVVLNTGVFAAWLLAPRLGLTRFMQCNFTARPASGRVLTMLTSVFSHKAAAHFLFNNLALWSVGASALTALAVQQVWRSRKQSVPDASPMPQFLAFFVTAGTFASLASHLVTAARWRFASNVLRDATRALPRASSSVRAQLHSTARTASVALMQLAQRASLGSSGAIYAAFVLSACAYPQASISIMFLPFTAIPIQWGMTGLVMLDVIGLLRGWRVFDHVAHLGGALFGLLYYVYGAAIWNAAKRQVAQFRHGKPGPQYA
ncbi:rhomboid protease [Malassezia brasiliensis]|uniref:Rhomboid protease n=1 Tax=Malassezia brasiliensis TaxID=1821822 RepID=A0AAF0DRJ9_9BASI|nr:rhomboid protease [Malassezia brasiliensis]